MSAQPQATSDVLNVLLILGKPHARRVFQHLLSNRGHNVSMVAEDDDVASLLKRGPYELVVVDTIAGEHDPATVLRTLRGIPGTRDALVLALTGDDDVQHLKSLVALGADEFVRMPAALDELEYRLDATLKLARRLRRAAPEAARSQPDGASAIGILPVAAFVLDERGIFKAVNRLFAELVGYSEGGLVGRSGEDVGLPDIGHFLQGGGGDQSPTGPTRDRLSLVRSDMTAVKVDLSSGIMNVEGEQRVIGVTQLLTESHRPDPLRTDARPASDDLAPGLSLVLDTQGCIRTISEPFADLLGESVDSLVGLDIRELVHDDDLKTVAAALRSGTTSITPTEQRVARFRRTDDDWYALAISGRDLADPHGSRGFLLVARQPVDQEETTDEAEDVRSASSAQAQPGSVESVERLQQALNRDQIQVAFQPEVDLGSGRIVGVEAFVRWDKDRSRRLSASEFLDEFAANGMAYDLDREVMRLCGEHVPDWLELPSLEARFRVGVSLSAATVLQGAAIDVVRSEARRSHIPQSRLRVSLPLSLAGSDPAALERAILGLRRVGIPTALTVADEAQLQNLPEKFLELLDVLKVPSSLLGELDQPALRNLMQREVSLVATAIETPDDYHRAQTLGIRVGQGYYFSHPVPADTFTFLAAAGPRPFASLVVEAVNANDSHHSATDGS